ncbi:MAG: hypothetical protein ABI791_12630 [Acidobacteriota bacterium]
MVSEQLAIIAGDGDSRETPVRFAPSYVAARVAAERRYISDRFGKENVDWEEQMHVTSLDFQSVWSIKLSDDTVRSVYFDTADTLYDDE